MEQTENQTDFYRWKHGLLFNQSEIELFASSGSSPEEKEFRAGFLVGLYKQGISYKDMTGASKMTEKEYERQEQRMDNAIELLIRAMVLIDGSQGNMQKAWLDNVSAFLKEN